MATHLLLLILFVFSFCPANFSAEIGRKELRNKEEDQETIIRNEHPIQSGRVDPSRVIQLSWRPRVFLYKGFLSDEECNLLISMAKGLKDKSTGGNIDSGKVDTGKLPNHSEISLSKHNSIEAIVEERISAWTFLPKENSKPLQVLHFGVEDAKAKYDYFGNKSMSTTNEALMATVVLFLSDVSQGGQILFPESELGNSRSKNMIWSDCGKSSKVLKPTKGNAMLFFNSRPNASPDRSSPHARCPVLGGEMWCATKVFYTSAITNKEVKVALALKDIDCTDEDENCPRWATMGECDKNPVYMIGSPDYYGTCRKSCNAC